MRTRVSLAILLIVFALAACATPAPTANPEVPTPEAPTPQPTVAPSATNTLVPPTKTIEPSPTATKTMTLAETATAVIATRTATPTAKPTERPAENEILIGTDFIALPKEVVEEMLKQPGNENRVILPIKPDNNTRLVYRQLRPDSKWVVLDVYDLSDRNVYNPTDGKTYLKLSNNRLDGVFIDTAIAGLEFAFGIDEKRPLLETPKYIATDSLGGVLYDSAVTKTEASGEQKGIMSVAYIYEAEASIEEIRLAFENLVLLTRGGRFIVLQ